MMRELLIGIAGGVITSALLAIVVMIRGGAVNSWSQFRFWWSVTSRMHKHGIRNFFADRGDYAIHRRQPSVSEFMKTARHEITYVGYWLAQGLEIDTIESTIRSMVSNGVTVELVLLSPALPRDRMRVLAAHLAVEEDSVKDRIKSTWSKVEALRAKLGAELGRRLILRQHSEVLSASAFIFDAGKPEEKMLVDFKLHGIGRQHSFGLELVPIPNQEVLYDRVKKSFFIIRDKATEIA